MGSVQMLDVVAVVEHQHLLVHLVICYPSLSYQSQFEHLVVVVEDDVVACRNSLDLSFQIACYSPNCSLLLVQLQFLELVHMQCMAYFDHRIDHTCYLALGNYGIGTGLASCMGVDM